MLSALAGVLAAAALVGAEPASAAFAAKVKTGTLTITGDAASDKLALRLAPGSPGTLQVDVGDDGTAEFSFDRSTFTRIVVDAGRGDDQVRIDSSGGVFTDELVTLNGGPGADTLLGGFGDETLNGGAGNDLVDGGSGTDRVLLGDGDDRFLWFPGRGSDVVDGQKGVDRLEFDGSNAGETIGISAVAGHVRFSRDVAAVVTDLDNVEAIAYRAFGGADTVQVNDLAGTDAKAVDVDLQLAGSGDGQADRVIVAGTSGADVIDASSTGDGLAVSGLAAGIEVRSAETSLDAVRLALDGGDSARYLGSAAADTIGLADIDNAANVYQDGSPRLAVTGGKLAVLGNAGADMIQAIGILSAYTALTLDGGDDGDTLLGSHGIDTLLGGQGDDYVDGGPGIDAVFLGDGDDRFNWDPGDGSDAVDGQTGNDRLEFNGSNANEIFGIAANDGLVRFTRNVANVVTDLDNVETIALRALGGTDTITVDDLTGTDATSVALDLAAFDGAGDTLADTVIVNGTAGADVVDVTRAGSEVLASGLAALTRIAGSEAAYDTLRIQTGAGDDAVAVAADVAELITPLVDLGADE